MPRVPAYESPSLLPPNFYDVREQAKELAKKRPSVAKKDSGRSRPWDEVTGVCLHQTAVWLGERPGRWASLGAHVGITREGKVIWVHDFDKIIYHGNGWNNRTIGIEIDGRYRGVESDPTTLWKHKTQKAQKLTQPTIDAACKTIRWICEYVSLRKGKVEFLVAHRQSSKTRRSDPGSAIWQKIALPMSEEFGFSDGGEGFEIGGRPIPEAWNPAYVGQKY